MRITLNGEPHVIDDACTVAELVGKHPPRHRAYAVEVNAEVVPRADHGERNLKDGDVVEIVTLVGGG